MKSSESIDQLAPALFAARKDLKPIFKSSRVEFGQTKYNYATEEDWYKGTQGALEKHELMLTTSVDQVEELADVTTRNGAIEHRVRIHGSARLLHVSGQWIENSGVGEGQSGNDKAAYSAQTGLKKYLYALMFALPTTDDPECVPHEDVVKQKNEGGKLSRAISEIEAARSYQSFVEVQGRIALQKWTPEESAKLMEVCSRRADCLAAKICKIMSELPTVEALNESRAKIEKTDYYELKHKAEILATIDRTKGALAEK